MPELKVQDLNEIESGDEIKEGEEQHYLMQQMHFRGATRNHHAILWYKSHQEQQSRTGTKNQNCRSGQKGTIEAADRDDIQQCLLFSRLYNQCLREI